MGAELYLQKTKRMGIKDATADIPGSFHVFGQCDPPVKIDYIFTNGIVCAAKIIPDAHPVGVWYSDHYALYTELHPKTQ